jgi:Flp pilus assembly protein TadG
VNGRAGRGSRGQATVEVALVLPLVVIFALAVIQVGVLVHDQLLVTAAAREGVRAAAVSTADADARRAAGAIGGLAEDRLSVEVARDPGEGRLVTVRVSYAARTDVPIVGVLISDVSLFATAVMRSET